MVAEDELKLILRRVEKCSMVHEDADFMGGFGGFQEPRSMTIRKLEIMFRRGTRESPCGSR